MEPWQFALVMFGTMMLYCLVLPVGGGTLMYEGLKRAGMQEKAPFGLCFKVAFATTYAAFFVVFALRHLNVLPDQSNIAGRLVMTATLTTLQIVLVLLLMKNNDSKAVAIEAAAAAASLLRSQFSGSGSSPGSATTLIST